MSDLNLAELDRLERKGQGLAVFGLPERDIELLFGQLRPLLDLVDRLGKGLDWALTYTNARKVGESVATDNPLHARALDAAITARDDWRRARCGDTLCWADERQQTVKEQLVEALGQLADDATRLLDALDAGDDRRKMRRYHMKLASTICVIADPALDRARAERNKWKEDE